MARVAEGERIVVRPPIIVKARDTGEILVFDSVAAAEGYIEHYDVDEYGPIFDSRGRRLTLRVVPPIDNRHDYGVALDEGSDVDPAALRELLKTSLGFETENHSDLADLVKTARERFITG